MKKIGIDCRLIQETGVGVYIQNLLRYLPLSQSDIEWVFFIKQNGNKKIEEIVGHNKHTVIESNYSWHSIDEQTKFLYLVNSYNLDLMHFPYFSFPIFYSRPFVITIHDLIPLRTKTGIVTTLNPILYNIKHIGYKITLSAGVKRSKAILTPSNSIKKEIVSHFGKRIGHKIHVTYEGVNDELISTKQEKRLISKYSKPFLVRFGNFYPHKNIERLIASFSLIDSDVNLVLVGPKDFFSSRMEELAQAVEKKDNIIFHFNATIAECVFFYRNALGLIQPSVSEGFGLPLIEAMYFNCPIIASKIPIFEELLGTDHKYFFDPSEIDSIKQTLNRFLKTYKKRVDSYDNSEIIDKFSFKHMAEKTFEIYSQALNEK